MDIYGLLCENLFISKTFHLKEEKVMILISKFKKIDGLKDLKCFRYRRRPNAKPSNYFTAKIRYFCK